MSAYRPPDPSVWEYLRLGLTLDDIDPIGLDEGANEEWEDVQWSLWNDLDSFFSHPLFNETES